MADVLGILFSADPRTEFRGAPQEIPVDAIISRQHAFSSKVTEATVEDGSSINDHVILEPRVLTIEGFVSDHPIDLIAGNVAALTQSVGSLFGAQVELRSKTAAQALEEAWRKKALLEVVTKLKTYKNMVIRKLEIAESATVGQGLAFTMEVQQIRKATLQASSANLSEDLADLGGGATDRGRQASAPPAHQEQSRSIATTASRLGL